MCRIYYRGGWQRLDLLAREIVEKAAGGNGAEGRDARLNAGLLTDDGREAGPSVRKMN